MIKSVWHQPFMIKWALLRLVQTTPRLNGEKWHCSFLACHLQLPTAFILLTLLLPFFLCLSITDRGDLNSWIIFCFCLNPKPIIEETLCVSTGNKIIKTAPSPTQLLKFGSSFMDFSLLGDAFLRADPIQCQTRINVLLILHSIQWSILSFKNMYFIHKICFIR